ncbi:MAG TPA: lipid-A-disaccharide synthase [Acidobacteriaceae bacterium]|jgi:lipid-A-disaccharide synthase|nr:lipid-A-disaccharide synthase [Acidobacteriaceae bacterium]
MPLHSDRLKLIATPSNPRIFLSAGEASGDAYGAQLIAALRHRLPSAAFTGLGGALMAEQRQTQTVRAQDVAVMGVTEILRHIPHIYASYRRLVRSIRRDRPSIAILIDFPDVNFRLARHLRRLGVPVVWLVSPQLWAWKRRRLRWVQSRVDKMLVIFPFEEPFYRARGVDAEFIGHPLLHPQTEPSKTIQNPSSDREEVAKKYGLDPAKTWIALLPGSRWKEIRAILPALHELAMSDLIATAAAETTFDGHRISTPRDPAAHTRYEFLLPVASTINPSALTTYIAELNREHLKYFGPEASTIRLTLITGPDAAREALTHARASVVASGTATVLAALVGNPFVVVYRVSPLTFALARRLVRYPEEFPNLADASGNQPVAMPNLIAARRIVPELLQSRFTAANVASELAPLLIENPEPDAPRNLQIAALARLRHQLLPPENPTQPPLDRAADIVLNLLSTNPGAPSSPRSG